MAIRRAEKPEDMGRRLEGDLYEALTQRDTYKRHRDELIANLHRLERILLHAKTLSLSSPEITLLEYIDNELLEEYYEYDSNVDPTLSPARYERYARAGEPCNNCKHCKQDTAEEA